jgi:hypothetical protein
MGAFFKATVDEFLRTSASEILHTLHRQIAAEVTQLYTAQHGAWEAQLPVLASALGAVADSMPQAREWGALLEYSIPGRRKRLDAVILTERGVIAIEFKVGATTFESGDRWQLKVYCWNLRDFHRESRGRIIAPILVATEAERSGRLIELPAPMDRAGLVLKMQLVTPNDLAAAIKHAYNAMPAVGSATLNIDAWNDSQTEPTENILEAAQRLFSAHDVREIDHANADNTDAAVQQILDIVRDAKEHGRRCICFVTGVPGAGKTLVGLRAAYSPAMQKRIGGAACFASGNIPLINVLTRALELNRAKKRGTRREIGHAVGAPFWNVHHFAAAHLKDPGARPPAFHVVIFDEAQRVWTRDKVLESQKKRQHRKGDFDKLPEPFWNYSEPELLLNVMERHTDWCVVVALVGAGQEIHDGEAGLAEWGRALEKHAKKWTLWCSSVALNGGPTMADQKLFDRGSNRNAAVVDAQTLHLAVTKRSRRAEHLTQWVDHVLRGDSQGARKIFEQLIEFPIVMVRDIQHAKRLVRAYGGTETRFGLVASSEGDRLRAEGIEVSMEFRHGIDFADWFVRTEGNIHSSNQLEVAATEFECQGLELDWTCVCWGNDFVFSAQQNAWVFWRLWGASLRPVTESDEQTLARNVYRVLLTRAREGMVLFVPHGDERDSTRPPHFYDETAEFLQRCGVHPTTK